MNTATDNPTEREFVVRTSPKTVKIFDDPLNPGLKIIHAYVPVRNFPNGDIPDDVNPRSHEKLPTRLMEAIEDSVKEYPKWFHLLNRGIVVIAREAEYDEKEHMLRFTVGAEDENGVADGATTDRVLARLKIGTPPVNVATTAEQTEGQIVEIQNEVLPQLQDASVHIEIIAGKIGDMLVPLTGARNTSNQVKEFALENLGGGFNWLKEALGDTEFKDRVRYRENDPEAVDVRTVLGLLTLFHPKFNEEKREPIVSYANKGSVLDYYREDAWKPGYEALRPLVADILRLYDYIAVSFPVQYDKYRESLGQRAGRLGQRKEVGFKEKGAYTLPLTQAKTPYRIPDGWLYPLLAAFRMLIDFSGSRASWYFDPQRFFDTIGATMVADIVEESEAMGKSAQAVGKSRPLWNALRKSVEMRRLNLVVDGKGLPEPEVAIAHASDYAEEGVPVTAGSAPSDEEPQEQRRGKRKKKK